MMGPNDIYRPPFEGGMMPPGMGPPGMMGPRGHMMGPNGPIMMGPDGGMGGPGRDSAAQLSKGAASSVDISLGGGGVTTNANDIDNIIQDEMVDINKFRYQGQMSNVIFSTCPIIPKYHTTFGEPIERQEISAEFEQTKDSDPKKGQAQK